MTNGEKMISAFPNGEVRKCEKGVVFSTGGWCHAYADEWWNAECEEPTKNDSEIDIAIKIIKADDLAPYSVEDILKARDLAVEALKQMGTTKNDSKFCPDRKAKTTHMETLLHCVEDECVAYKDGKCLKYNSDQEPTTKNDLGVDCISRDVVKNYIQAHIHEIITESGVDKNMHTNRVLRSMIHGVNCMPSVTPQLSVPEVTALAEWTEKLTKASEDAYNKGYADGVKSVNICPHCGEYIGEEE